MLLCIPTTSQRLPHQRGQNLLVSEKPRSGGGMKEAHFPRWRISRRDAERASGALQRSLRQRNGILRPSACRWVVSRPARRPGSLPRASLYARGLDSSTSVLPGLSECLRYCHTSFHCSGDLVCSINLASIRVCALRTLQASVASGREKSRSRS